MFEAFSGFSARIRLIPEDEALLRCLDLPEEFKQCYKADALAYAGNAKSLVKESLEFYKRAGANAPWTGYLAVDRAADLVVGCCGFKGNPSSTGDVEIAYHTFSDYENRGFATAMGHELVRIARQVGGVREVIAHTLTERNASARVLTKLGFSHRGQLRDPDDGPVWQWRLPLR